VADHLDLSLRDGADYLGEEVCFRGEVAIDGAHADLGHRGDGGDLRLTKPALADELASRAENAVPVARQAGLDLVGSPVGHGRNPDSVLG
jgi:hypothetical protein